MAKTTEIEVYRWKIFLKGGGVNYTERGTIFHAFSIIVTFHDHPHQGCIPKLTIGNVKGLFNREGIFQLEPRARQELLRALLERDCEKVYFDNASLAEKIGKLPHQTWDGVKFWFEYALNGDQIDRLYEVFEAYLPKLAHYLGNKVEEAITQEYGNRVKQYKTVR